jgi:hypothetical protein
MRQVKNVIVINSQWNEKFSPENFKRKDHKATEIFDYNLYSIIASIELFLLVLLPYPARKMPCSYNLALCIRTGRAAFWETLNRIALLLQYDFCPSFLTLSRSLFHYIYFPQ